MRMHEICGAVLAGDLGQAAAPDEGAWHRTWKEKAASVSPPIVLSACGGALADRLAWAFHAGYQGAIRQSFPEFASDRRSIAYLTSEDREGKLPGTRLTPDPAAGGMMLLSGNKAWVAAARTVELLLVSVGTGPDRRFAPVERTAQGVTLDPGEPKAFLHELSQGRARFDAVAVPEADLLPGGDPSAAFGTAEPLHVFTAINAFVLSHAWRWQGGEDVAAMAATLLTAGEGMAERPSEAPDLALGTRGLEAATGKLAREFASLASARDPALAERWQRDHRLLSFYGRATAAATRRLRPDP